MSSNRERHESRGDRPAPGASIRRARVLLVDDDVDTRELLALVLARDGCAISQAGDVAGALRLLRAGGFHLVITDYELPDGTGGQLIGQAAAERLLQDCAVLVVTGHPDPEDVGAAPVIPKPFDPEAVRRQVGHILQESSPRAASMPGPGHGIELVLYVARGSPASKLAERNARQILARVPAGAAHLEVRDVGERPRDAEQDRILFVPTLVARCTPPVWVMGSLRNPAALLDILSLCGADRPPS